MESDQLTVLPIKSVCASPSKDLLKHEHFTREDHIQSLFEKSKEKPVMKFSRSSVLDRIRSFLPVAASSEPPCAKDIVEVDDEYEGPVVEMNVQLFPMSEEDSDESNSGDEEFREKKQTRPVVTVLDSEGNSDSPSSIVLTTEEEANT